MTADTTRPLRLVHYINAFFGGIGGEAEAHHAVQTHAGPLGPGMLLQQLCGGQAEVIGTVVCGDGYFGEHEEAVVERVRQYVRQQGADAFIAGPAFGSGRYGLACGRLCLEVERLGIPAVTGLHIENPGGEVFLPQHIFAVSTTASAAGMQPALQRMAALTLKRARGDSLGSAAQEGFLPRDVRRTVDTGLPAARRAVDLALRKWKGEPYASEITVETFEPVPPPPPLADPSRTRFALVTECGLVPKGNPDRLPAAGASHWAAYAIGDMQHLMPGDWDIVHGGYDNTAALLDPNRVVPLDAMRALQREGIIGGLLDDLLVTVGNLASLSAMKKIGAEMAATLKQRGVGAVMLPAT